jgi:hypothetical protein
MLGWQEGECLIKSSVLHVLGLRRYALLLLQLYVNAGEICIRGNELPFAGGTGVDDVVVLGGHYKLG